MGHIRTLAIFSHLILVTSAKGSEHSNSLCPKKVYLNGKNRELFLPTSMGFDLNFDVVSGGTGKVDLSKTQKNPPNYLSFKEGHYEIPVPSTPQQTYKFTSDGTSPHTKVTLNESPKIEKNGVIYYGKNFGILFEGLDELSGSQGVFLSTNNSDFKNIDNKKIPFTNDGHFNLKYYACDNVGNQEPLNQLTFKIDTTAPITIANFNKDNISLVNPKSLIELKSSDQGIGIDKVFYKIDNGKELEYLNEIPLDNIKSGGFLFSYFGRDKLGNEEKPKLLKFRMDADLPKIEISYSKDSYKEGDLIYLPKDADIGVKALDAETKIKTTEVFIDNTKREIIKNKVFSSSKPGLHKLKVISSDIAGNKSQEEHTFYIDAKAPTANFSIISPVSRRKNILVANPPLKFVITGEDDQSGVDQFTFCIEKKCQQFNNKPIEYSQEGLLELSYYSTDRVGNRSEVKSQSILIEKSKAIAKADKIEGAEKKWVYDTKHGAIGPSDKGFAIEIADGMGPDAQKFKIVFPYDGVIEKFLSADKNSREIRIAAAGFEADFKLPIDDTKPNSKHIFSGAKQYVSAETTWFGPGLNIQIFSKDSTNENESGIHRILYSLNNSEYKSFNEPLVGFDIEQKYLLQYYAVDRVGNIEDVKAIPFIIDKSPPQTKVVFSKDSYRSTISSNGSISLDSIDSRSGVSKSYYKFDQGEYQLYSEVDLHTKLRSLSAGKHLITYYAIDNVGNREKEKAKEFTIDTKGPIVSYSFQGPHYKGQDLHYIKKKSSIFLDVVDAFSGVNETSIALKDEKKRVNRSVEIGEMIENFSQTIIFNSVDNLGNKSQSEPIVVVKDLEPPTSTVRFVGNHYRFDDAIFLGHGSSIVIEAKDLGSGVKAIKYRINNEDYKDYVSPISFSKVGELTISFYAIDNLGNREKPQLFRVIIDTEEPTLVLSDANGEPVPPRGVMEQGKILQITAFDNHSGIKNILYRVNGGSENLYRKPIKLDNKGNVSLSVVAIDWMGKQKKKEYSYTVK